VTYHHPDRPTLAEAEADDAYCGTFAHTLDAERKRLQTALESANPFTGEIRHEPVHHVRESVLHPGTALHQYDCSCGWKGLVWMSTDERARAIYDRNFYRETGTHR
jgi:hypothetical protein